jgi:hypothetical protein
VPDGPVPDGRPQLQRRAEEELENPAGHAVAPLVQLRRRDRMPCSILLQPAKLVR